MKALMQFLLFVTASIGAAQDSSTDNASMVPSMSLTQFQTVLQTFLDDELAVVVDGLASASDGFDLADEGYMTSVDDESNDELNATVLSTEFMLDNMLKNRVSFVETDSNGQRRRVLKNHHHRHSNHKHSKSDKSAQTPEAPHKRGRFVDVDPSSIPVEVNATWDGIISHAWDMAKLSAKPAKGPSKVRASERRSRTSSADSSDSDESMDNLFEDSDELVLNWSDETETLFLICHSSQQELDGNSHLKEILTAAGKDVNVLDTNESFEVVHSSPLLTCIILSMPPTHAWNIAQRGSTRADNTSIHIAPWVDVMKISPEVFDQIVTVDERVTNDSSSEHSKERGLRNFRRVQDNFTEILDDKDSLFWVAKSDSNASSMEKKYIVFSLFSSSTLEDANNVIQSLVEMATVGQRRRRTTSEDVYESDLSISDAFSISGARVNGSSKLASSSVHHWSRLLQSGLESENGCSELFENTSIQPSLVKSSYEFLLSPDDTMSSTLFTACVASAVAGIAVNARVLNVGIVPKEVELDNHKAQWVLQGSMVKADDSTSWRLPFFDAGLKGQGQIVSVSDTGLDTENCYFKDARGNGNIFTKWDTSRRKVVRYDVSPRGGDSSDAYKGHGSHVVGTLTGRNIRGKMGNGDDPKEGMAPAAKVHFFDIGLGNAVNDPREAWVDSFYQNGRNRGAKVASGSWGFGYRTSYDWVCKLYDQLVYDHPDVIHLSSAGNTGNQYSIPFNTIGAPASCKNPFAVGATNNADFGSGVSYVVDFSSRGPTADGRTKPDIMAPGYALDSASSGFNKCAQEEPVYLKAGTSMATPVVAGASALVRQYFLHGYYPCGSKRCSKSIAPSGALVKAVLANGAQPLNGVQVGGTTTVLSGQKTVPYDHTQNMGISNLLTSLPLKDENDFSIFVQNDVSLSSGQKLIFDFVINRSSCSSDFAATIAWYDPPSSNGCTKCLVNDLDLLVENVHSGKKHFPNGLTRPDTINNLERVRVNDTVSGHKYRVSVQASMLGPGYTKQSFALVVTGCFGDDVPSEETQTPQPSVATSSHNLPTTYNANRKQAGNMFSIEAKIDGVQVTSFAFHTLLADQTVKMHVYTLNSYGSYEPFITNPAAWTRVSPANGIDVQAKGYGTPTVIPVGSFAPVAIPKGRMQSFYITFVNKTEMLYKAVNNDYPTGSVFSSDKAIAIYSGVGKGLDFGATWRHRQMNGAVYYSVTG